MMMADGAAPYICSTLVPFRFGFGSPIPCSLEATHTRELKDWCRERESDGIGLILLWKGICIFLNEWRSTLPRPGRHRLEQQSTIFAVQIKTNWTTKKTVRQFAILRESRVVGEVDKIKDKRDLFGHLTLSHSQINSQHCIQFCRRGCCYRFALMHWHYPICQSFIWTNIRAAS